MKLKLLFVAALAIIAVGAVVFARGAQAQEGGPTSGTLLAGDLSGMTGSAVGPDGAIYVVDAGTGGENVVQLPEEMGGGEANWGLTARIIRVDPEDGAITAAATNLPSFESEDGAFSAADITFMGNDLYWLLSGSVNLLGGDLEDWPNGVYKVTGGDDDEHELVADISEFNDDNPVDFEDAAPGGNPFAIEVRGSGFIVSDGNYNRLLQVATTGSISLLAEFDNVVPTGLETGGSTVLNTWFSAFPHNPEDSKVVSVSVPGGAVTEVASGVAQMIDVTAGPDGNIYVLQFGDQQNDENAPPSPTGRIYRWEDDGSLTALVEGFTLATSLNFSGDTAYVTTLFGEVWQIENFSSIAPLPEPTPMPTAQPTMAPPQPTPTAGGGIAPPDTGGGYADSGSGMPVGVLALAIAGAAAVMGGATLAFVRRR